MKRLFDLVISLILISLLIPFLTLVCLLILFDSGLPIIFYSKRVGTNGKIFMMPKFRTMYVGTEIVETNKLKNSSKKITKIGKILRKFSIDELPQLISVIKGNLSLVGPRPAITSQKKLLKIRKKFGIDKIKPGITGYAQINGRDFLDLDEKIYLEKQYMIKKSFFFDLKILIKTIKKVFANDDIIN